MYRVGVARAASADVCDFRVNPDSAPLVNFVSWPLLSTTTRENDG
jgi:hypothetical protein